MKERKENFEASVFETLRLANELAKLSKLKAVNSLYFLCALIRMPNNILHQYLISKKVTLEDIDQVTEELLNDFADEIANVANSLISGAENEKVSDENMLDETGNYVEEEYEYEDIVYSTFTGKNGEMYSLSKDMYEIIENAILIRDKKDDKSLTCNHIASAIITTQSEAIAEMLKYFDINPDFAMIDLCNAADILYYPQSLENSIRDITAQVDKKSECSILGREIETNECVRVLLKQTKRNIAIIGEPGVGKTALVEKLAWMIATSNCPEELKKMRIISLDVNSMIAGTTLRGQAEEKFKDLVMFLQWNTNVILFIDEIHMIMKAGDHDDGGLNLANVLKPILARGETRIIGATTSSEYEKYFAKDGALQRRFERILVKEPKFAEIPKILQKKIEKLKKYHHVRISDEMVKYVMTMSACFYFSNVNEPDRTLDGIDRSMAEAKLQGKNEVTKALVNQSFQINMERYKLANLDEKRKTAYHEAGHFIVSYFAPKYSKSINTLAVSILPSQDYLGVHVYENKDAGFICDLEFYKEMIAAMLAGRVGEKKFSAVNTSGASSDLRKATEIARKVIVEYGLLNKFSKNRIYDKNLSNEKSIDSLNAGIDLIIEEATMIASKILKEHDSTFKKIANKLIRHGVLTIEELEKICNEENDATEDVKANS